MNGELSRMLFCVLWYRFRIHSCVFAPFVHNLEFPGHESNSSTGAKCALYLEVHVAWQCAVPSKRESCEGSAETETHKTGAKISSGRSAKGYH